MSYLRQILRSIFTWWHSQTVGTALYTWRHGVACGVDEFGNRYYTNRVGTRRWVIFRGEVEASRVPPLWHAWLHFTAPLPPTQNALPYAWSKPHIPNVTGTQAAHRPHSDKTYRPGKYTAWQDKPSHHD